jgi:hypothetical protein
MIVCGGLGAAAAAVGLGVLARRRAGQPVATAR